MRGGVSSLPRGKASYRQSSPRAWGCFHPCGQVHRPQDVFPTCVGVFLNANRRSSETSCLPHVRGGVSDMEDATADRKQSSPRAWGCFRLLVCIDSQGCVFPTCVGVFLFSSQKLARNLGLPHVRGGVSKWGKNEHQIFRVFPTCVGVFLSFFRSSIADFGLPHVRGGVSHTVIARAWDRQSSPRAWGCFCKPMIVADVVRVFPTCVGVFLLISSNFVPTSGLPHVRGGVSREGASMLHAKTSSPRAWGCFPVRPDRTFNPVVFPTCVGVFPSPSAVTLSAPGLPHVRGGVSENIAEMAWKIQSSPRAWGCFYLRHSSPEAHSVFPTCVGVFPTGYPATSPCGRLPHVRGGVSFLHFCNFL